MKRRSRRCLSPSEGQRPGPPSRAGTAAGAAEEEAGAITLGFWGGLVEFQLCSPRCITPMPPLHKGWCLGAGPHSGLCICLQTLARLVSSPLLPCSGCGGEISAQKKHHFSFASAGGRRAAAASAPGPSGFPHGAQCPHEGHILVGDVVSECNHLSTRCFLEHKYHPAGLGLGCLEGPGELHASRMQQKRLLGGIKIRQNKTLQDGKH